MMFIVYLCLFATASAQWELVFQDEFDGDEINPEYWSHEITAVGGGNGEFQTYTPDTANSYVSDGYLTIKPTLLRDNINPLTGEPFGEDFINNGNMDLTELYGKCTGAPDGGGPDNDIGCVRSGGEIPPIASARLRSYQLFAFRYGRVEISAKMPVGDWLWPAMWLLPDEWVYGGWPMSGEIDITESISNRDFVCGESDYRGVQHMGSTLHWGQQPQSDNRYYLTTGEKTNMDQNYGDSFHDYVLEWDAEGLEFFVDGELVVTIPGGQKIDQYPPGDCFLGWWEFGKPWTNNSRNVWTDNYNDYLMAPFDQEFHFIFNVAVGGTGGFMPDGCVNKGGAPEMQKPWTNGVSQVEGMHDFYDAEEYWYPTWTSEDDTDNLAMKIDYVRVYQREGGYDETTTPEWCPRGPCRDWDK